jgi:hypothetical protein
METGHPGGDAEKSEVKDMGMHFHYHKNKQGVALVTALLMVTISLAIVIAVLSLITRGTSVSSLTRQYHTAHEAAYGGAEFVAKEIIPRVISGTTFATLGTYNNQLTYGNNACFSNKLNPIDGTSPANWGGCDTTSLDLPNGSDLRIRLQGTASKANFDVFVKIVESTRGNSSTSGNSLDTGSAVASSASGYVTPVHIPFTYRLEIQAQRSVNPSERANLSGLYVY